MKNSTTTQYKSSFFQNYTNDGKLKTLVKIQSLHLQPPNVVLRGST